MKSFVRFLTAATLGLAIVLSSVACGTENTSKSEKEKNDVPVKSELVEPIVEKEDDSENVKNAYEALNTAYSQTSLAMDDIYKSWYFTVYVSGEFDSSGWGGSGYYYIDSYYPTYIGREYETVKYSFEQLFDESYTSMWLKAAIKEVSTGVPLIVQILEDEGVYSTIDTEMTKAKEALKVVNKDNECYENLMSYYTEMLSFYEFAKSPSGSFSNLEETVSSYEKNIDNYKNRLSIYIE